MIISKIITCLFDMEVHYPPNVPGRKKIHLEDMQIAIGIPVFKLTLAQPRALLR